MPDNKRLPARTKLTKRADAYRRAVRANSGMTNRGQTPRTKTTRRLRRQR